MEAISTPPIAWPDGEPPGRPRRLYPDQSIALLRRHQTVPLSPEHHSANTGPLQGEPDVKWVQGRRRGFLFVFHIVSFCPSKWTFPGASIHHRSYADHVPARTMNMLLATQECEPLYLFPAQLSRLA